MQNNSVHFKALRTKCEALTRGVTRLEDKCTNLSTNVDQLSSQLERSAQNESELQVRVSDLSRSLNITSSNTHGIQDEIEQLQRALANSESERKVGWPMAPGLISSGGFWHPNDSSFLFP